MLDTTAKIGEKIKMKTQTFFIIAGIAATGVVAYTVWRYYCATKNEDYQKVSDYNGGINDTPDTAVSEGAYAPTATYVYETREAVAHSVRDRHSEAASIMKQSLNTIFNDPENDDVETENSQVLRETSSDLDDLLK